ncbi:MAG: transglycosylase SLT domain-containing protein [Candidatus Zixiibacteriota bacterium]
MNGTPAPGRRPGVVIGRPIALIIALVWAAQTVGFALVIRENSTQQQTIHRQEEEIRRLKERLKVLEIIEDYQTNISSDEAVELAQHISDCGRMYGFDPLLVLAMIQVESSFGTRAVSHKGACGLMQMKPSTARAVVTNLGWTWENDEALFEPVTNVRLGTQYLFDLVLKFRSVEKAIIAYNHGETAVRGMIAGGMKLPQAYLGRVLREYHRLQRRYDPSRVPGFIGPIAP